jgi:hypothetical protein
MSVNVTIHATENGFGSASRCRIVRRLTISAHAIFAGGAMSIVHALDASIQRLTPGGDFRSAQVFQNMVLRSVYITMSFFGLHAHTVDALGIGGAGARKFLTAAIIV